MVNKFISIKEAAAYAVCMSFFQLQVGKHGNSVVPAMVGLLPNKFLSNKNFILFAVGLNGFALRYASDDLKDDLEVVYEAMTQEPISISYASKNMQIMFRDKDDFYGDIKRVVATRRIEAAHAALQENLAHRPVSNSKPLKI